MTANRDKIVFFGHHKCGSRYFRLSLLAPLLQANGYEILSSSIKNKPFHFRLAHELDLESFPFERLSQPGRMLLNLSNASQAVVERVLIAEPDVTGIHVVRDPRQVLVSDYFHHREGHHVENPAGWVWDALKEDRPHLLQLPQEEGLIYELEHITDDVLRNQLDAWRPLPGVLEFRIEDFSGATGYDWPPIGRLVDFLGVDVRPPLQFRQTFSNIASSSWREVFTPRLTALFKEKWGHLLLRYGYETSMDWAA